ncbi:choice-of-anchor D domain-containing protein, partial [Cystobacter fuscus]|uniref:choice-of-anchor D domain-containing protein n=1 Tax=Cystobacter fuscus TaxID=43 RepID=UPI0012DDA80C
MLRFYVLALLLLGGLVSCGPSDAGKAALEDSLRVNAMEGALVINPDAGTRVITRSNDSALRLEWDGGGPGNSTGCLRCRTSNQYSCPESRTSPEFKRPIGYTLPPGLVVIGAKANVYGATVNGGSDDVIVKLNSLPLTTGNPSKPNISSTTRGCTNQTASGYKCDSPDGGANGFAVSVSDKAQGIAWVTNTGAAAGTDGGTTSGTDAGAGADAGTTQGNLFVLEPENDGYCISHVDLELTVVERHIKTVPTKLEFDNQAIGTESNPKSVDVINSGAASLTISKIEVSEGFILVEPTVPDTGLVVDPAGMGASPLQIKVKFAPGDKVLPFSGKLKITSDAMEEVLPVDLSGTGVEFVTQVDKNALEFGLVRAKSSHTSGVKIYNAGRDTLTITPSFTADSDPSFSLDPTTAGPIFIPGGLEETINVIFQGPEDTEEEVSGDLVLGIQGDPKNGSKVIHLTGSANKPVLPANPTLNFGAQRAGTSVEDTVTVTNTGSRSITFSSIGTPDPTYFEILEQKPAGASVTLQGGGGANSTLSFRVRFKV